MLATLAVFALVFAAEFAASVWDGAYQTAVRKRQLRSRLLYGGLLQLLGWADYVGADRFSLLAAFPGSILGSLAGDWYGGRRSTIQHRMKRKRQREAGAGVIPAPRGPAGPRPAGPPGGSARAGGR